jgi:hypothetical protein
VREQLSDEQLKIEAMFGIFEALLAPECLLETVVQLGFSLFNSVAACTLTRGGHWLLNGVSLVIRVHWVNK